MILAEATNEQIGVLVFGLAALLGLVATMISIASYFATRREVEDLKTRVNNLEDNLDKKTSKLHTRINRLLAGQMMIAGQLNVALDKGHLKEMMQQLEAEEEYSE